MKVGSFLHGRIRPVTASRWTENGTLSLLIFRNAHITHFVPPRFQIPVRRAWGLSVNNVTDRNSSVSNSNITLLLPISTSQGYICLKRASRKPNTPRAKVKTKQVATISTAVCNPHHKYSPCAIFICTLFHSYHLVSLNEKGSVLELAGIGTACDNLRESMAPSVMYEEKGLENALG